MPRPEAHRQPPAASQAVQVDQHPTGEAAPQHLAVGGGLPQAPQLQPAGGVGLHLQSGAGAAQALLVDGFVAAAEAATVKALPDAVARMLVGQSGIPLTGLDPTPVVHGKLMVAAWAAEGPHVAGRRHDVADESARCILGPSVAGRSGSPVGSQSESKSRTFFQGPGQDQGTWSLPPPTAQGSSIRSGSAGLGSNMSSSSVNSILSSFSASSSSGNVYHG
jgi:hypothetical protein